MNQKASLVYLHFQIQILKFQEGSFQKQTQNAYDQLLGLLPGV